MTDKIEIEISDRAAAWADPEQLAKTVRHTLKELGVAAAAVSVAIVGHDEISQLKKQYFGRLESTDVISFDLRDEPEASKLDCEIVVNAQQARQEAQARKGNRQAELNLYVVHGLLHQLGYDDHNDTEAQLMHQKEDELLEKLGFGKVFVQVK